MHTILNQHVETTKFSHEHGASRRDLNQAFNPTESDVLRMGDHRFKGYPGEFMFSPRAPVTYKPSNYQATKFSAKQAQPKVGNTPVSTHPAVENPLHTQTLQQLRDAHEKMMAEKRSAELRKYQAQREIADKDIAQFKEEQLRMRLSREVEKKRDLEQLRSYNPWGKPGHGAPIDPELHKKQKFTEYDLFGPYGDITPKMHMGSNSSNGNSIEPNNADQQLQEKAIQETQERIDSIRKEIDNLHPNQANGMPGRNRYPNDKPFEFYDPWGKGMGNPRRQKDGYTERFPQIKEVGIVPTSVKRDSWPGATKSEYYFDDTRYEPHLSRMPEFGTLMPPAVSLSASEIRNIPDQAKDKNIGTGLSLNNPYGGGGEAVKTSSGNARTRVPITLRRDIYGNAMKEVDGYNPFKSTQGTSTNSYNPFGKPGAGAPLRDSFGKINSHRHNIDFAHELDTSDDITKRRMAADEYLNELKREMAEQRRNREEANVEYKAPIGELAAVVQQGKVGNPKRDPATGKLLNQHLSTSDVTKHKVGQHNKKKYVEGVAEEDYSEALKHAKEYHSDLTKLAEERHRVRQLEKVRDTQEDIKHSQRWNDMWGRPGGGAPNTKRSKLQKTLYNSDTKQGNLYAKNTPQGITQSSPRGYHQKTTIPSNHSNMFELKQDRTQHLAQTGYYPLAPPFATL